MKVKAKLNNLRISPRKVRLVADLIRGLDVSDAKTQLNFLVKKSSKPILKLLDSALANASNNFKLDKDNLYISEIFVNEGPTLKRIMPRAMGRAFYIRKRTSHITLVLQEKEKPTKTQSKIPEKKDKEKKEEKKDKTEKKVEKKEVKNKSK